MSTPPPPGWQPQQPGQPPHNAPPYGSQPGNFPTGGYPQGGWPQQPPPPKGGNTTKLLLIAIAVLLVIGVTIGATLFFTRSESKPTSTADSPNIASADDTGAVSIITEEPTCDAYVRINNVLADVQANGWGAGRGSLPDKASWTPDQQKMMAEVLTATRNSADQVVELAKQTPHRVVRELYQQFIAYGRAYSDSLSHYAAIDNYLASAYVSAASALVTLCDVISQGSSDRAIAVELPPPPPSVSNATDVENPDKFLQGPNDSCARWLEIDKSFPVATAAWQSMDSSIDGSQWSAEQRSTQLDALPKLSQLADELSSLGIQSDNAILRDFAEAAAVYIRGYVSAGTSYVAADSFLTATAFRFRNIVSAACGFVKS